LGGDLWTVLQEHKFFDERTSKFMTGCVVEAMSYLHSKNMIYRFDSCVDYVYNYFNTINLIAEI
jgi:hypothetical protein